MRKIQAITFAGKNLQIITIDKNGITAKIDQIDYQDGSYKIQVTKTKCNNKIGIMDATIKKNLPQAPHYNRLYHQKSFKCPNLPLINY